MNTRIDTGVIKSTADKIKAQNNKLSATLESTKNVIHGLRGVWSGDAAESTINAFDRFYNKYAQEYEKDLNEFVNFLNSNAAEGYEATERKVQREADEI